MGSVAGVLVRNKRRGNVRSAEENDLEPARCADAVEILRELWNNHRELLRSLYVGPEYGRHGVRGGRERDGHGVWGKLSDRIGKR